MPTAQEEAAWNQERQHISKAIQAFDNDLEWRAKTLRTWKQLGGRTLEPALRSGAIALVDAQWLVNFAMSTPKKTKKSSKSKRRSSSKKPVLPHRQALPPEAFLSCDEIIASTTNDSIAILTLSYCWLSPKHPDPKGRTLQMVAKKCQQMMLRGLVDKDMSSFPRLGVFWDYASLHQHPKPSKDKFRTKEEEELFQQALRALPLIYSHPFCQFAKVTKYPTIKKRGEIRRVDYNTRGWPLVENAWASLNKTKWTRIEDLNHRSELGGTIRVPITPQHLWSQLENATFSNPEDDKPLAIQLYTASFVQHFGGMQNLDYRGARWGDIHMSQLAEIIRGGYLKAVKEFDVSDNYFGPIGCKSLVDAFSHRKARCHPTTLCVGDNCRIGAGGLKELARLIVKVEHVNIQKSGIGSAGCQALAEAADKAYPSVKLNRLTMSGNPIGGTGMARLASLVVSSLRKAEFKHCNVCNNGCKALADAAFALHCDSPLEELDLSANEQIDEDGVAYIGQLLRYCPQMKLLILDESLLKNEKMLQSLASSPTLEIKASSAGSFAPVIRKRKKRRAPPPMGQF